MAEPLAVLSSCSLPDVFIRLCRTQLIFKKTQRILLQRHLTKLLKFLERIFAINHAFHSVGRSFRKGDSDRHDTSSGNHITVGLCHRFTPYYSTV